jgi:hypothetical protein
VIATGGDRHRRFYVFPFQHQSLIFERLYLSAERTLRIATAYPRNIGHEDAIPHQRKGSVMKRLVIATALLAALSSAAYAENWQRIDVTNEGTIIEIDLDTVRQKNGTTSVMTNHGTVYFDCNGHYGSSPIRLQHISSGSIADETADTVCKK